MTKLTCLLMMIVLSSNCFGQSGVKEKFQKQSFDQFYVGATVKAVKFVYSPQLCIADLTLQTERGPVRYFSVELSASTSPSYFKARYIGQFVLVNTSFRLQHKYGINLYSEQVLRLATDADKLMTVEPL